MKKERLKIEGKKKIGEEKKSEKKGGMLFTLSAFFLVSSLLALAILFGTKTDIEKDFALERVHEISSSVEKSILEIFYAFSDYNISITRNGKADVTIIEKNSRVRGDWGEKFVNVIKKFKNFVETEEKNIKINTSDMENKELPLLIEPHNITYSRYWGIGHVVISVNPSKLNFGSYDITINSGDVKIKNVLTNFRTAGNFLFKIRAKDSKWNDITKEKYIDPYDNHQAQIFFVNGNKVMITLDKARLEIWANEESKILVETKIDNLQETEEKIRVKLFDSALNVSFAELGVSRLSSIAIEE